MTSTIPTTSTDERRAQAIILIAAQHYVAEFDPGHTPTSSDISEFHGYLPNSPEPMVVAVFTEAIGLQELIERWDDDDPDCVAMVQQRDRLLADAIRCDRSAGAR